MRYSCFLAILAVTSLLGVLSTGCPGSVSRAETAWDRLEAPPIVPPANVCGPNALYVFLKLHERRVSADVFFRAVDPGDLGLSLTDLKNTSDRYGLPADVRRSTYEQLVNGCSLPLIALLRPGIQSASSAPGHYVLVLEADSEGVTLIDGTSGWHEWHSRNEFCRSWKGYVVVAAWGQPNWLLLLAINVAAWAVVALLIIPSYRHGARSSDSTNSGVSTDARTK
jgi:hypothetical protein